MMSQGKKDISSSIFFFVLGLFLAIQSVRLSVWGRSGPEAGFFPLVTAVLMVGLSLGIMIKSFTLIRAKKKEKMLKDQERGEVSIFKVSSYAVLMTLYVTSIERVGFLISSTLFLILILKYVEGQRWKTTFAVWFVSIGVSYILFVYFLGVPLPRGIIKWL